VLKQTRVILAAILGLIVISMYPVEAASSEQLSGYEAFALEQTLGTWQSAQGYSLAQLANVSATLVLSENVAYVSLNDTNKTPAVKTVYSVAQDGTLTKVASLPSGTQTKLPGVHVAALQAVFIFRNVNPPPQAVNFFSEYGAGAVVSTQYYGKLYGVGLEEAPGPPPAGYVWLDAGINEQYHVAPVTFAVTRLQPFP